MIRTIVDRLHVDGYLEISSRAQELERELLRSKEIIGDRTSEVVRELHRAIKNRLTDDQIDSYIARLKDSFVVRSKQIPLLVDNSPNLALAVLED